MKISKTNGKKYEDQYNSFFRSYCMHVFAIVSWHMAKPGELPSSLFPIGLQPCTTDPAGAFIQDANYIHNGDKWVLVTQIQF